jgi:PAS domain S-box-containing protein
MIGYTPEEIVREPDLWFDILHPEDRDAVLRADAAHFSSGGSARQEYRVQARDGRVVWIRDEATVVAGEDGHPEFSQGILSDITEAKATEQTLRRQALIFDNVHDAVLIVDLDGRILDLNPGAQIMFGSSAEEVRGTVPEFLSGVEPHPRVLATVTSEGRWSGEVEVPSDDETPRVAELIVVPLKDAEDEMLGMVGVLRDVTRRKSAEEELRRNVDLLRASDQERRQLVSRLVAAREEEARRIASEIHDDPIQKLSAAALRLGMLAKEVDPEKRAETIAQVRTAVDETLNRLRHMLFELTPRTLETNGLGEALKEYVEHANREGLTRYDLDDQLRADLKVENRIIAYRVILEAMSNVRKHASATHATVSLADLDGGVRFSVTDDGKGIVPEDLGVSLPGHMGTASMRQHVEMAGGWITLNSVPGQGTTVEFWLPRT